MSGRDGKYLESDIIRNRVQEFLHPRAIQAQFCRLAIVLTQFTFLKIQY
jgi:hypothetical protein